MGDKSRGGIKNRSINRRLMNAPCHQGKTMTGPDLYVSEIGKTKRKSNRVVIKKNRIKGYNAAKREIVAHLSHIHLQLSHIMIS